jgi:anti-sigma-K factor RskA
VADPEDVTAAELALGVLEGDERATALRRVLAEPGFAATVEWWRERFAALFDLWPEVAAPAHIETRIAATLDGAAVATRGFPWPLLAIASSAIAACLLLFILVDPRPSVPVSQPVPAARPTSLLVATLDAGEDGQVAAAFDPAAGALRIAAGAEDVGADAGGSGADLARRGAGDFGRADRWVADRQADRTDYRQGCAGAGLTPPSS